MDWSRITDWFPRRAVENISILTVAQFVVYAAALLYGIAGARIMGSKRFGQLVLVISLVKLFAGPFHLKLASPLTKRIGQFRQEGNPVEICRSICVAEVLQLCAMGVFLLVFAVVLVGLPPYWTLFRDWQTALALFAVSEVSLNCRLVAPVFDALEKYGHRSAYQILVAVFRNGIPIGFMPFGVEATCLGYVIAEGALVLISLGIAVVYRGYRLIEDLRVGINEFHDTLDDLYHLGRSNYLASLFKVVRSRAKPLIIGQLVSPSGVAFFNIGSKFQYFLKFSARPVSTYLFPRLVGKWERDRQEFFYTLRKYFYQSVPFYLLTGTVLMILTPWFLPFLYGDEFIPAIPVAWIIIPAAAINMVFYIFRSVVFASNRPRALFNLQVLQLVVSLSLTLVLTFVYSYVGTAWAVLGTSVLMVGYRIYFFVRSFGWRWILPARAG